ncbi:MAG: hypothetical protein ACYTFY_07970 [Planctomycetota bacterium]|jgi:hypothetical protein
MKFNLYAGPRKILGAFFMLPACIVIALAIVYGVLTLNIAAGSAISFIFGCAICHGKLFGDRKQVDDSEE